MEETLHVHGIATVGSEVELLLLRLLAKAKGTVLSNLRAECAHVLRFSFVFVGEVLLDDVVRLHVDLLVGVVLAVMDLLHTTDFLDEERIAVDGLAGLTSGFLVHLTDLEYVLQAVKSHLNNLVVWASEQITQWPNATALNQITDLIRLLKTARSSVGDGPTSFLARLKVAVLEEIDKRRNNVCIDHGLDLSRVASSDVGDGPAGLLANAILGRAQQR